VVLRLVESQPNTTLVQTGHLFQPIAEETIGSLNESSIAFLELGRKIAYVSGDNRESPAFFPAHFDHKSALELHLVTKQFL